MPLGASDLPFVGMMDKEYDYYMLSYSPYDSMENRGYPAMLVAAGCVILRFNSGSRQNG
jgi:protease II